MKRLVVITVGKTHSGKSTFAKKLAKKLNNSFVMDQDNHAEFINKYYRNLQPKQGPNVLKHEISQLIVNYAKKHSNLHFIISNSNRSRKGRSFLLKELFPANDFIRILVYFDISDDLLQSRIMNSNRSTNIFRFASSFSEVLKRQQADSLNPDITKPVEGEADYLFIIKNNETLESTIKRIVNIADH